MLIAYFCELYVNEDLFANGFWSRCLAILQVLLLNVVRYCKLLSTQTVKEVVRHFFRIPTHTRAPSNVMCKCFFTVGQAFLALILLSHSAIAQLESLFQSKLESAVQRGMAADSDLNHELSKFFNEEQEFVISSVADAMTLYEALKELPLDPNKSIPVGDDRSAVDVLAEMVDYAEEDGRSFDVVYGKCLPELARICDELIKRAESLEQPENVRLQAEQDVLKILDVFITYGNAEGYRRFYNAARKNIAVQDSDWYWQFDRMEVDHPWRERIVSDFSLELPNGEIAAGLLHAANDWCLDDDTAKHPFNNEQGYKRLREYLETEEDRYEPIGYRAAVALAFISREQCQQLLPLAFSNKDEEVVMEAAWSVLGKALKKGLRSSKNLPRI